MNPKSLDLVWRSFEEKADAQRKKRPAPVPAVVFSGAHDIHTPRVLCKEILDNLELSNKSILVLFNIEFVLSLIGDFGIESRNITFYSDHHTKTHYAKTLGADIVTELESSMKFDVVIGNPPYKFGNEKGGKSSLWRRIVSQAWSLTNKDGAMAMVTPQFPNASKDLGNIVTENQTTVVWSHDHVKEYFPGVGSTFSAWIVINQPKTKPTHFINENLYIDVTRKQLPNNIKAISILDKVFAAELFDCKSSPEYSSGQVADGNDDHHLFSKSTPSHPFVLRRTSGDNYQMYGAVKPTDYDLPKVVLTFSGNPHFRFHDRDEPIGTIRYQSGHILVKDKTEGANLIALYNTRFYKFIQNQLGTGGMRGKVCYDLPKLDLSKVWTDEELFAHFKLTQDEISIVTND